MTARQNQLAYQESAVRNAGPIDLVIILYDILARDLHSAIEAMQAGNIELRSAKLKHGFLALQQLEGSLNMDESVMATNMSRFYSMLRGQIMLAQVRQDPAVLEELVQLLFSVREAWVELNTRLSATAETATQPTPLTADEPIPEPQQVPSASWKA